MDLKQIQNKVSNNEYDLSEHAHTERQAEHITIEEIEKAILSGEIIENYSKDERGESVLIGAKLINRGLHVVCGTRSGRILIVTVYEPKPLKWINYKTRSRPLKDRV